MNYIAKSLLNRRLHRKRHIFGSDRFRVWRDLGIWWSPNVNPVSLVSPRERLNLPHDLLHTFFPHKATDVKIRPDGATPNCDATTVRIDDMDDIENENLNEARHRMSEYAAHRESHLGLWYVQAARDFVEQGNALVALRAFLNHQRVSINGPAEGTVDLQIGDCLVELGEPEKGAQYYVRAAEGCLSSCHEQSAADAYERAGLAWEATHDTERPSLIYSGRGRITTYDSTVCFRMAKNYSAIVGDYDSSSRCFILERDSQRRWTPSMMRRIELSSMRTLWLYGESPLHAIRSVLLVWVAFAVAFFFSGFKSGPTTINYNLSWHFDLSVIPDFAKSLYFSAVTMSTLGYGDYAPASTMSMCFAGLEAFLGIILAAMLLVSVQRRYVGR